MISVNTEAHSWPGEKKTPSAQPQTRGSITLAGTVTGERAERPKEPDWAGPVSVSSDLDRTPAPALALCCLGQGQVCHVLFLVTPFLGLY